jgi:hypothetical protein
MLILALLSLSLAIWPFDSALDTDSALKLIQSTIQELGASEEESGLLAKAYVDKNQQLSMESIVNDIKDKKLAQFISGWRRDLFKDIVSKEAFELSESIQGSPFNYEIFKALTMTFDEYMGKKQVASENLEETKECPDGSKNSFHI